MKSNLRLLDGVGGIPRISIPTELAVVSTWSALGLGLNLLSAVAIYQASDASSYASLQVAALMVSP